MMEAIELYESVAIGRRETAADNGAPAATRGEDLIERLHRKGSFIVEGVALGFEDDVWDLSDSVSKPLAKSDSQIDFSGLGAFADLVKLYCFEALSKTRVSVTTLRDDVVNLKRFLGEVERAGYFDVPAIPHYLYVQHFGEPAGIGYRTFSKRRKAVRKFLEHYEASFSPLPDRRCLKLLARQDARQRKAAAEAGKRDEIEETYLEELLLVCHRVALDPSARLDDRIVACCLMMYSQIGCRTGEMGTFRVGAVSKTEGKNRGRDLWHAEFMYSKKKGRRRSWVPTTCYLNDFALGAFRMLEELCSGARDRAGTDALVVFENGATVNAKTFSDRYRRFAWRNLCTAPFLNCPDLRKGMHAKSAMSAATEWNLCKTEDSARRALAARGLSEDDMLTYPEIRMFRNSVCTGLYRRKVSLKWIGEHLNHLYKDMEAYYNRADREIDEAFSNEVYRAVVTEGARITGPSGDEFDRMVRDFIDKGKLRSTIEESPEAVIEKLSRKFPLKKKRHGMCIRCAGIIPCAVDGLTDEIVCAVGVCPNHASTYWMAPGSYADAKEAALVVSANIERGRAKEARHELGKLKRIVEARLAPEVGELSRVVGDLGADRVLADRPELERMIANIDQIREEIAEWTEWTL